MHIENLGIILNHLGKSIAVNTTKKWWRTTLYKKSKRNGDDKEYQIAIFAE